MEDCNSENEICTPIVSVIVPVYNVEKYLRRCIESILSQTFRDYELILIDDGSTDSSGRICDYYAKTNPAIRVIHQKNMGLAEVRNIGIQKAKGKYIQFVDSDDWIASNLLERCIAIMSETGADIVCFRILLSYQNGKEKSNSDCNYSKLIMNTSEALSSIFFPGFVDVISCNKFIKREVLNGISYPQGKLYEDMYTTYKIISQSRIVVCIDDELYHYYQTPQSIGHQPFSTDTYELGKAAEECFRYSKSIAGVSVDSLEVGLWYWKSVVVNRMIRSKIINKKYVKSLQRDIILGKVFNCPYFSWIKKIQIIVFKYSFSLYEAILLIHDSHIMDA